MVLTVVVDTQAMLAHSLPVVRVFPYAATDATAGSRVGWMDDEPHCGSPVSYALISAFRRSIMFLRV